MSENGIFVGFDEAVQGSLGACVLLEHKQNNSNTSKTHNPDNPNLDEDNEFLFAYFEDGAAESVVFSIDLRLCRFDHVLIKLFLKAHFGKRERSDLIFTWLAVDEVIEAVSIEFEGKRRKAPEVLVLVNFLKIRLC